MTETISTPAFGNLIGSWHRWFAWKPVKTYDQRLVWLRFVWRRGVYKHDYLPGGRDFWWWYSLDAPEQRGRYVLDLEHCSGPAIETFDKFLALVKHGAKFIDIHVRKDGKEYQFQADILKYMTKHNPTLRPVREPSAGFPCPVENHKKR